ncbi:hypothetical protein HPB49_026675 [Dermacentor silvarum]|nr:hypothetical protein HPB49_026675 [Dermacentor silvarum]
MVRKLKYHEQKLLKKVDFISWEVDNNLHEVKIMRKYYVQKREDYTKYNKLSRAIRDLARKIKELDPKDPFRAKATTDLLNKLVSLAWSLRFLALITNRCDDYDENFNFGEGGIGEKPLVEGSGDVFGDSLGPVDDRPPCLRSPTTKGHLPLLHAQPRCPARTPLAIHVRRSHVRTASSTATSVPDWNATRHSSGAAAQGPAVLGSASVSSTGSRTPGSSDARVHAHLHDPMHLAMDVSPGRTSRLVHPRSSELLPAWFEHCEITLVPPCSCTRSLLPGAWVAAPIF